MNKEYKYKDLTGAIIGAAMAVHRAMGNGFQEVIYQRALEIEFSCIQLNFKREFVMPINYHGVQIGTRRVDFLINNLVSVELKSVINLEDVHLAQAINYLEAYNPEVGLLLNFGSKSLEYRKLYNSRFHPANP
ncbi:MAG: GxxExxY protein [Bacteroidales bacterium]|nr:GxxExxY protein [Bacteroidales bacterium]